MSSLVAQPSDGIGRTVDSHSKCNTWEKASAGVLKSRHLRGIVVGGDEATEPTAGKRGEIGYARNEATHAAEGIFDAALLPG